jgi:hypothetical protein
MHSSDHLIYWRVSKANAAAMAVWFVVIGLILASMGNAPAWSALYFVLAFPCGVWWGYRWLSDHLLAQRNHHVQTMSPARQVQLAPATTTPGSDASLFLPSTPDTPATPLQPDARS